MLLVPAYGRIMKVLEVIHHPAGPCTCMRDLSCWDSPALQRALRKSRRPYMVSWWLDSRAPISFGVTWVLGSNMPNIGHVQSRSLCTRTRTSNNVIMLVQFTLWRASMHGLPMVLHLIASICCSASQSKSPGDSEFLVMALLSSHLSRRRSGSRINFVEASPPDCFSSLRAGKDRPMSARGGFCV